MESHRKEVSESRAKQRKLEADSRQMEDLKNRVTELETKNSKLTKDASKYKEQEDELNETKSKNRELQRQVRYFYFFSILRTPPEWILTPRVHFSYIYMRLEAGKLF